MITITAAKMDTAPATRAATRLDSRPDATTTAMGAMIKTSMTPMATRTIWARKVSTRKAIGKATAEATTKPIRATAIGTTTATMIGTTMVTATATVIDGDTTTTTKLTT